MKNKSNVPLAWLFEAMRSITITMLLLVCTGVVFAQSENDFEVEQLTDGTLRITGYNGPRENITIPGQLFGLPVSEIGVRSFGAVGLNADFGSNRPIHTVTIENGIKKIGNLAFNATRLQYIYFPDTLEEIGENAFRWCDLRELKLPRSLTKIGRYAFDGAFGNFESSLTIPSSVKSIGNRAFGVGSGDSSYPKIRELVLEGIFSKDRGNPFDFDYYNIPYLEKITIPANWSDENLDIDLPKGFVTAYKIQGRKGGVYVKNSPIWTLSQ